eukprot:CAMPEP_0116973228 /NCGR_PEP_ID=MMETSP0467-20121206/54362_1 /TAXON_ID=283647 /ORGANISM="Mesodinium pulex, Strain SPMC105" /LENGTH=54 /DNA_ID=CAMNT_0004664969 /DNA_START=113 /DNA_END=274 /DNA_ORIENTATION=-
MDVNAVEQRDYNANLIPDNPDNLNQNDSNKIYQIRTNSHITNDTDEKLSHRMES